MSRTTPPTVSYPPAPTLLASVPVLCLPLTLTTDAPWLVRAGGCIMAVWAFRRVVSSLFPVEAGRGGKDPPGKRRR